MRTLYWDIETAAFANYKGPASDWGPILCIGYVWEDDRKPTVLKLSDYDTWPGDLTNDELMIRDFLSVLESADVSVTHYGKKFDIPFLNGRMLMHGVGPIPPIKHIDTWEIAKKNLRLSSNRLKTIAKLLDVDCQKLENDWPGWWFKALGGNKKAMSDLAKYCGGDVMALRDVDRKLRVLDKSRGMPTVIKTQCPSCLGVSGVKKGFWTNVTGVYQRYQCKECGHWFRGTEKLVRQPPSQTKVI